MHALPTVNKELFEKDGFLIIKNLFSAQEIEQLRVDCYEQFEMDTKSNMNYAISNTSARSSKGDLLSKSKLSKIILDERVLHVAKSLLGDHVVYFGDSNYQIGSGLRGYHRDNVDRNFNSGPDWQGDYSILRFGLYMQDHAKNSGGLKVKKGSHKNASGESLILKTNVGDLVVWSLKTLHSGNAVRLKIAPNQPIDYLERHVPNFLKLDEDKERIACFFSYGVDDTHLQRYMTEYLQKASGALNNLKNSPLKENQEFSLQEKGVKLVKPVPEYGL